MKSSGQVTEVIELAESDRLTSVDLLENGINRYALPRTNGAGL
jgi:hypothetical protein